VDDALAEVERAGLELAREPRRFKVSLTTENGARQSAVLHRFRVLAIPGFVLNRGPSLSRANTDLSEEWSIARRLETDPALIEAALYGATLEAAATGKLEERSRDAEDVGVLAETLFDAALCGIHAHTRRCLTDIARVVATEPSFEVLGSALAKLLALRRGDVVLGARGRIELRQVLAACFDRGLWLFEGIQGASAPLHEGHVRAVRALRDLLRLGAGEIDGAQVRARELCERRTKDPEAPPALRGAALGVLWSTREADGESDEPQAIAVLRATARPATIGDFLGGLFALAREEVVRANELVATIDALVTGFLREDFLIALPALRQAFAFFPPRERLAIAQSILQIGGQTKADPMQLLRAPVDAAVVQRGAAIERGSAALALRFGLTDSHDEEVRRA
jgi:hypothetical protein